MHSNQQVALVLGAIKGIGKSIGMTLAQSGIPVALTYYDWEKTLNGCRRISAKSVRNTSSHASICLKRKPSTP